MSNFDDGESFANDDKYDDLEYRLSPPAFELIVKIRLLALIDALGGTMLSVDPAIVATRLASRFNDPVFAIMSKQEWHRCLRAELREELQDESQFVRLIVTMVAIRTAEELS